MQSRPQIWHAMRDLASRSLGLDFPRFSFYSCDSISRRDTFQFLGKFMMAALVYVGTFGKERLRQRCQLDGFWESRCALSVPPRIIRSSFSILLSFKWNFSLPTAWLEFCTSFCPSLEQFGKKCKNLATLDYPGCSQSKLASVESEHFFPSH